jgi:hypothetical protein
MLKSVFAPKPALALAAILTVGSLPSATDASAGYYGHRSAYRDDGYRSYPYRPYGHRRYANRSFHYYHYYHYRRGFRPYPRYYYYGYSCERMRWVLTQYGWRLRPVNSCYPYYRSYYDYD